METPSLLTSVLSSSSRSLNASYLSSALMEGVLVYIYSVLGRDHVLVPRPSVVPILELDLLNKKYQHLQVVTKKLYSV